MRDRAVTILLLACLALASCHRTGVVAAPHASGPVLWVWSGAVTPTSAVVTARLGPGNGRAVLRFHPTADPAALHVLRPDDPAASTGPRLPDVVTFRLRGLEPGTDYRYVVESETGGGRSGHLRTVVDGPMPFRIGFASCATTGSNHRIFDTLRELDLDLFIHMGDFHYEDITENDPARFLEAYDRVLTSPRQGAFYRSTPIAYVWDDHDYGSNDSDRTSPSRPAALSTYRQCVPHYPLVNEDGAVRTIQQGFTIGRVRFLMTDPRAARDPEGQTDGPRKSMLGDAQRTWLIDALRAARDDAGIALVVWVNGVPWITRDAPGSEHGWEPYSHERTVIADSIRSLGLADRLVMLSGDAHMVAIDDGTHSNDASDRAPGEPAFPVVQAAPLDRYPRVKGGPYSLGRHAPHRWFPLAKARQFGLMEVEDDSETLRVTLSCRDSAGHVVEDLVLRVACTAAGCRIAR
jgi:phosphodiesterase/alkaline phosphatase D-like protein